MQGKYYLDKEAIWATSSRVGSTSIASAFGGHTLPVEEAASSDLPVVLFVRHPLDRIVSCFLEFNKGRTFVEFLEVVKTVKNHHWYPQVKLHTYEGEFIPTKVLPMSEIPFPKKNVSEAREPWESYYTDPQLEEMLTLYSADVALVGALIE